MKIVNPNDPHIKITLSIPLSLHKELEQEQDNLGNQVGFAVPLSRVAVNAMRRGLSKK